MDHVTPLYPASKFARAYCDMQDGKRNPAQVLGKLGRLTPSEQVCAVVARQVGKIVAGRHRHDRGGRVGAPSVALEAFEIRPASVIQLQYKAARPGVAFAICPGPHGDYSEGGSRDVDQLSIDMARAKAAVETTLRPYLDAPTFGEFLFPPELVRAIRRAGSVTAAINRL